MEFKQPLSIYIVWHNSDNETLASSIEYCFDYLKRDLKKPFSRSLNLPVFYRTSLNKSAPTEINSKSVKTLIFVFISKHVVADEEWREYTSSLLDKYKNYCVPIAVDRTAYGLNEDIKNRNFIRSYSFEKEYFKENLLINISHEIYRLALNESYDEMKLGTDTAIELFLSHTKDGKQGLNIAETLKNFIDNSSMRNFFDATDIAPGYVFDKEIENHIKKSTVISINSDPYSTRYWCQREILCAKENERPIIAVDCLEEYEDRRFPYSSNIPGVHMHPDNNGVVNKKDVFRILIYTMIETIRFFYSKQLISEYQKGGWFDKDSIILSRPPDFSDLNKITDINKHTSIIYPEPPVYEDELKIYKMLKIHAQTPMQFINFKLKGDIGISISDLSKSETTVLGHSSEHLKLLSQDIARHLLARETILSYGGDLRSNGFTEFLLLEAQALQVRLRTDKIFLKNYLSWPIYNNDKKLLIDWISKYNLISETIKISPPEDIIAMISSTDDFILPETPENLYLWSKSLSKMREIMIDKSQARICAGGRCYGYKGKMPGVLEEIIIAIKNNKPVYLLGGFGGITQSVCKSIETGEIDERITSAWQKENNSGYESLLNFIKEKDEKYLPVYDLLYDLLTFKNLNNGLTDEENIILFNTEFNDVAIYLILKGLSHI